MSDYVDFSNVWRVLWSPGTGFLEIYGYTSPGFAHYQRTFTVVNNDFTRQREDAIDQLAKRFRPLLIGFLHGERKIHCSLFERLGGEDLLRRGHVESVVNANGYLRLSPLSLAFMDGVEDRCRLCDRKVVSEFFADVSAVDFSGPRVDWTPVEFECWSCPPANIVQRALRGLRVLE